jgi:hypothetical protein
LTTFPLNLFRNSHSCKSSSKKKSSRSFLPRRATETPAIQQGKFHIKGYSENRKQKQPSATEEPSSVFPKTPSSFDLKAQKTLFVLLGKKSSGVCMLENKKREVVQFCQHDQSHASKPRQQQVL